MSVGAVLVSFLYLCLEIAVIVLIAFVILWVVQNLMGIALDANVLKWGQIVVALICLILVVVWLFSLLGGTPIGGPHFLWRW